MFKSRYTVLALIILFGLQACSSNKYLSQPATADFRIDGERNEWAGRFETPKKEKFAIGVSNDKNYLYLAIMSLDQEFERQLAVRGLTLWLDVKGGKRENLGLKFQGRVPMNSRPNRTMDRENMASRRDMMRNGSRINGDLDLLIIDNDKERLGPADLMATASVTDGGLFLEYQVPLALLGDDFDVEKILGFGLNSEFDKSNMKPQGRSGGMSSGGMGGKSGGGQRGGGGHGGGGGGKSGMQGQRPDQDDLEVWIKVQLSPPQ